MKVLLGLVMSMFLYSGIASARSSELDRSLQAMAMLQIMGNPELQNKIIEESKSRNIFDTIESVKKNVGGLIESFLTTFDTNGNGWIDPGAETENLVKTLNDVVLLFVDGNKNGSIEPQEIAALAKQVIDQVSSGIEETVCNKVIVDAQKLGDFIVFNPLLKAAYERCTDLGLVD